MPDLRIKRRLRPPVELPPAQESVWSNPESVEEADPPAPQPMRRSLRVWMAGWSPAQQLGYGCIAIMMVGALVLYCMGAATLFVRPMIAERPPTPTNIVHPTLAPTPTQEVVPTFFQLPGGTLVATPTQAPLPTREPVTREAPSATTSPGGLAVTPSPTGRGNGLPPPPPTGSGSGTFTPSPTTRASPSATTRSTATATRQPLPHSIEQTEQ